jgi:hypothetical protein
MIVSPFQMRDWKPLDHAMVVESPSDLLVSSYPFRRGLKYWGRREWVEIACRIDSPIQKVQWKALHHNMTFFRLSATYLPIGAVDRTERASMC